MLDRRQVAAGLAAAAALPLGARLSSGAALAQAPASTGSAWRELADLSQEAQRLGLSVPRMGLTASAGGGGFNETLPAVIDFMDGVTASAKDARGVSSAEVDGLLERASDILRAARNAERGPREGPDEMRAAPVKVPAFDDIAEDYRRLFATCVITEAKRNEVNWYVSKIVDADRRKAYEQVYEETCVPWYFVAITHGMEGSFDMKAHLHNGEFLEEKDGAGAQGPPRPLEPALRLGVERGRRHEGRQVPGEGGLGPGEGPL